MATTCPPGYGKNGWSCEICPMGTYGRGVCLPCPPNSFNLKAGSTYCDPCPPGAYVGTQCHPVENPLLLSLLGLVFKCGFITTSTLSVIFALILIWLKASRRARPKILPTFLRTSSHSDEFRYSRVPSCAPFEAPPGSSSSDIDLDVARVDAVGARRASRTTTTTRTKTSSTSTRTARVRVDGPSEGDDDEEGASCDGSGVVGNGAGGDASPDKRLLILKRVEERGATRPVDDVDIQQKKKREAILERLRKSGQAKWALGGDTS